jgi:hypothetical protein
VVDKTITETAVLVPIPKNRNALGGRGTAPISRVVNEMQIRSSSQGIPDPLEPWENTGNHQLKPQGWWLSERRWACLTVFGPGVVRSTQVPGRLKRRTAYAAYARHLVTHGTKAWPAAKTVHELDQLAMAATMSTNVYRPAGLPQDGSAHLFECRPRHELAQRSLTMESADATV